MTNASLERTIAGLPALLAAQASTGPVVVMIGRVFSDYAADTAQAEPRLAHGQG